MTFMPSLPAKIRTVSRKCPRHHAAAPKRSAAKGFVDVWVADCALLPWPEHLGR